MFGGIQGLFNMGLANKSNKELGKLLGQDPVYQKSPFAARRLGLAQQLFGGRMFGAPQLERNLFTTQGNTLDFIKRNATDASQALAFGAAAQGQTDQGLSDLQVAESQNKYSMLNNLNSAYDAVINEDDKVFNDQTRRFGNRVSIKGAQQQNRMAGVNSVFNGLNSDFNDALSVFGMMSGFGGGSAGSGRRV